ncbi:MAG: DUF2948 family protein [Henriciella sp.]
MARPSGLRLVAEDATDLQIVSAAVQDAVLKPEDIRYIQSGHRLDLQLNRFRWEIDKSDTRIRSVLSFNSVMSVMSRGISQQGAGNVLSLLSIAFEPDQDPPGGCIRLIFSDKGELRVKVEALEVLLLDGEHQWSTPRRPRHEKRVPK